jgi:hypothetical protein
MPQDDRLADLMLAVTLSDDGSHVNKQPSKLWSSREEFQASRPQVTPQRVSLEEIHHSFSAIVNKPAVNASPSLISSMPNSLALAPSPASPYTDASADPSPPTILMSPESPSGRPSTGPGIHPSRPQKAWLKKTLDLIDAIEKQVQEMETSLDIASQNFDTQDASQVATMRSTLEAAGQQISSAGISLKTVQRKEREVTSRKEALLERLKANDDRITLLGAALSPSSQNGAVRIDTEFLYENHEVEKLDTIAQIMILLVIACHVALGLGGSACNFILGVAAMLVKLTMAKSVSRCEETYDEHQHHILSQMPTSLFQALNIFKPDGKTTLYAACPICNFTYKPTVDNATATTTYPTLCTNRIAERHGSHICNTPLMESRNQHLRPIKPFLVASFTDYLARLLSDPAIEQLCDKACDDAMLSLNDPPDADVYSIFQAQFMKTFEGPITGQLFIDRGTKTRLAFIMHTDFFNPSGSRKRGNHDSIGVIYLASLNLPIEIRYLPENLFLAIIPGPREPEAAEISHYLRPIIDECVAAWKPGIHLSKTPSSKTGRDVDVAIVISVNDLPAARKVSGTAGHGSDFYCTVCNGFGRGNLYNTDFDTWVSWDIENMCRQSEAWRDAETLKEKDAIFDNHGVRWSEFWRLPYWNPGRMLVIDSMHCILLGLVYYHCRYVLGLDAKKANSSNPVIPAFSYSWTQYHDTVPTQYRMRNDQEIKQITEIHKILVLPFESGLESEKILKNKLLTKNLTPLKFVCYSLCLPQEVKNDRNDLVPAKRKAHFAQLLVNWVSFKSFLVLYSGADTLLSATDYAIRSN